MNVYRSLANRVGTPAALDLGDRLSDWHDAMVVHARRFGSSAGPDCDDDCPHAEAGALWLAAIEVLGDLALDLKFLSRHGAPRVVAALSQRESRKDWF